MKYLTTTTTPKLTITHTRRRCVTNHRTGLIELTESTLKLELTASSFVTGFKRVWRGLRRDISRAVANALTPNLAHYCAVA